MTSVESTNGEPAPALDDQRIAGLQALDTATGAGLFPRLVATFVNRGQELVSDVRAATRSGDHVALIAAAHELKGAAGTIGAVVVAEQSRMIEVAGQRREAPRPDLLDSLDLELRRAAEALERISEGPRSP